MSITFDKAARGPFAGDSTEITIRKNGEPVGCIEGEFADFGACTREYRINAYHVVVWGNENEPTFAPSDYATGARGALAAAKAWAKVNA